MYIHEHKEWPSFSWNKELVGEKLNKVNKAVGYLTGHLSVIGFNDKMSAVVESISHDIIASSEIEGVELNNEQVRSSVARKLGVQLPNQTKHCQRFLTRLYSGKTMPKQSCPNDNARS